MILYCSGPSTVSIENADRAVATASKLSIGEYKFKLTVKDNEGLTDSHVLTILVKQSKFYSFVFLQSRNQ